EARLTVAKNAAYQAGAKATAKLKENIARPKKAKRPTGKPKFGAGTDTIKKSAKTWMMLLQPCGVGIRKLAPFSLAVPEWETAWIPSINILDDTAGWPLRFGTICANVLPCEKTQPSGNGTVSGNNLPGIHCDYPWTLPYQLKTSPARQG
ncbi:MAG: hypothetical protein P8Z73_00200, partial [Desulfobacteraceae bacterium]